MLCISAGYYIASALCIAALFRASTADPGRLPVDPHIPHSGAETEKPALLSYHFTLSYEQKPAIRYCFSVSLVHVFTVYPLILTHVYK